MSDMSDMSDKEPKRVNSPVLVVLGLLHSDPRVNFASQNQPLFRGGGCRRKCHMKDRDVLDAQTCKVHEGIMKWLDALGSSEKTIAILVERWGPQTSKQERDKISFFSV